MMADFVEVNFNSSPAIQEILIGLLAESGFEGFEQEDDLLKAYVPRQQFDISPIIELAEKFQSPFTVKPVKQTNWNANWENSFQPVIIGDFAGIRAGFHDPLSGVEHEIIITPKMSFGTGHHATTSLMIRAMENQDFTGKSVLDFGTGTGILAILAEKLGASQVTAIDNDQWSIANAGENLQRNASSKTRLLMADLVPPGQTFDIILANINKQVLLENVHDLSSALRKNGRLIVSGILESDEPEIIHRYIEFSFKYGEKTQKDQWICLSFAHDF